jgi:hypothetical protein
MDSAVGGTEGGLAVWKLTLHGADVPGRRLIVEREFNPAPGEGGRFSSRAWNVTRDPAEPSDEANVPAKILGIPRIGMSLDVDQVGKSPVGNRR